MKTPQEIKALVEHAREHYTIVELTPEEAMMLLPFKFHIQVEGSPRDPVRKIHIYTN